MKETQDKIKEMKYQRECALTRKSLTYLDTNEDKLTTIRTKLSVRSKKIPKRYKTRNPYTLRIYRDGDQFEQILEMENRTSESIRDQLMLKLRYMTLFQKW